MVNVLHLSGTPRSTHTANKANPSWATFNAFRERSETIVAATPNGLVPRLTERQQMAILKRQEMAAGVDSLPPGKEEEVSRSGSEEEEEEHAEGAEFAPLPTAATKEVVTEVNLSKRKNASPVERTIVVEPAEETMSPLTAAALAPSSNEISILNGQHNLAIPSDVAMEDAEVDVGITDETMEDAASITAMDDAKVSAGTTTMDGAAEVPAEENPSKTDTDIITQSKSLPVTR